MAWRQSLDGPGPLATSADIVIPPGDRREVAQTLQHAGAIRLPDMFLFAAWWTRSAGPLHAGEFRFAAHSSLIEILNVLRHGAAVQHQVTIPEGLTGAQIAAILNAAPDATGMVNPPPEAAVLPQTYDYVYGTKRSAILHRSEAALTRQLAAAWAGRDTSIPLATPAQALTLAAIVQQETPLAPELPKIAAVYENRLSQGMKLQADPTVIYAATNGARSGGIAITRSDLANPSPYNTYVHPGLPPGPICAPGLAAINAVLHPANTRDLYFVATGTGGHVFAKTFQQQLKNIAAYESRK
ncbi:MAG: aminodeoxychorismate lyase [Rhodospirillales bacterium 20-64-7]|nr:MAG: aminodeoxychorismate lyase [Rhodospirillales bacterium 20-64-7]